MVLKTVNWQPMEMFSDPARDTRTAKRYSGGYEWWYFDAISADGKHSFVVIFYEGNPFSLRYIEALDETAEPVPSDFPAISISVYEEGKPIYYSFTEFDQEDCVFKEDQIYLEVGPHRMQGDITEDTLRYKLQLEEKLPGGDKLKADFHFVSNSSESLFDEKAQSMSGKHQWNLMQPRADVEGTIHIGSGGKKQIIFFQGTGYHDHNTGDQPMYEDFTDWYWGRFHFDYATLVYYAINREDQPQQQQAWLIDAQNHKVVDTFDQIHHSDTGRSVFGLSSAYKLEFRSDSAEVQIQQSNKIDNGPFYQRFLADGFLSMPDEGVLESCRGFSEYLRPDRIPARIFWPLVRMRIHHAHQKPHWVQRSGRLYRWTW